jgi:hypothetical protein
MWIKWWRSKTAWKLITAGIVAMVEAFLCAYYLPYPYNLIGAFACCIPSGIVIRKTIIKKLDEYVDNKK